jgi:hypothetical protein
MAVISAKRLERRERLKKRVVKSFNATTIIQDAVQQLVAAIPDAINVVKTMMKSGELSDRLKYDAAIKVLELAGIKHVDNTRTVEHSYTIEQLNNANATLKESITITERFTNNPSRFVLRQLEVEKPLVPSPVTDADSSRTGKVRPQEQPT